MKETTGNTARSLIETMGRDTRYAVRTLRKTPGFTIGSVAVLARDRRQYRDVQRAEYVSRRFPIDPRTSWQCCGAEIPSQRP